MVSNMAGKFKIKILKSLKIVAEALKHKNQRNKESK